MIIEPNIEALRVALVNGYVEDTLIDGLSTQEIASALQALFDVTATDMKVPFVQPGCRAKLSGTYSFRQRRGGVGTTRGPIPVSINKPEKRRKSVLPALL